MLRTRKAVNVFIADDYVGKVLEDIYIVFLVAPVVPCKAHTVEVVFRIGTAFSLRLRKVSQTTLSDPPSMSGKIVLLA